MTSIHTITTGTPVRGEYLGVPYTGVVDSLRAHTLNHHIMLFSVKLDAPITVFSTKRDAIQVTASDNRGALNRYLGMDADATPIEGNYILDSLGCLGA